MALPATARRVIAMIEPWYDWGTIGIERMDEAGADRFGSEGAVRFFQVQWFGLHIGFQIGRTPPATESYAFAREASR